jgi:hypothetical protein
MTSSPKGAKRRLDGLFAGAGAPAARAMIAYASFGGFATAVEIPQDQAGILGLTGSAEQINRDAPDAELLHRMAASVHHEAPPGYVSDMPSFKGALTHRAMVEILAVIKSHWPRGIRADQAYLNPGNRGLPMAAVDADWNLAIDCGSEPDHFSGTTRPPFAAPRAR